MCRCECRTWCRCCRSPSHRRPRGSLWSVPPRRFGALGPAACEGDRRRRPPHRWRRRQASSLNPRHSPTPRARAHPPELRSGRDQWRIRRRSWWHWQRTLGRACEPAAATGPFLVGEGIDRPGRSTSKPVYPLPAIPRGSAAMSSSKPRSGLRQSAQRARGQVDCPLGSGRAGRRRQWVFEPSRHNGVAVAVTMVIIVTLRSCKVAGNR